MGANCGDFILSGGGFLCPAGYITFFSAGHRQMSNSHQRACFMLDQIHGLVAEGRQFILVLW
jgi:hypothetical protein